MEDDLIIIDDHEEHAGPSTSASRSNNIPEQRTRAKVASESAASTPRLRGTHLHPETSDRTTRSSTQKPKLQPKLKLKLSEKAAAQAPGMSFLGPYDRELDSDDEDLHFEEQFILRMPPGEDTEKLRQIAASREVSNDVWFKFKDSRRAIFHIGNTNYSSKLVDLPCIIESQKTVDNKMMFKVADICQMLVVESRIENEDQVSQNRNINIEAFIWPHGITPPLHHARKRRFRKRVNKRTIESVEEEVERLLAADAVASEVKYDLLENVNPDLSDSEFMEREEPIYAPTLGVAGSEAGDAPTPGVGEADEGEADEDEEDEGEGDIDEELAAELDLALGDEEEEEDGGEEDDEDDESEEEEDDDDDDDEEVQARKLINEEIRDLENAVAKKANEVTSSANPLIKKRFEDALKKLTADLEMKHAQRDEMKEKQRRKKEGVTEDKGRGDAGNDADDDDETQEDGDLFGSDPAAMEID